jgi:hypothetical protein
VLPHQGREVVPDLNTQRAFNGIIGTIQSLQQILEPFAQPEDWQSLSLYSDWTRSQAGLEGPQFVKDPLGYVLLRGWAKTAAGASSTIATLPKNYRPRNRLSFACACISGVSNTFCRVDVYPDGVVSFASPAVGAGSEISLSNIRFDTRL